MLLCSFKVLKMLFLKMENPIRASSFGPCGAFYMPVSTEQGCVRSATVVHNGGIVGLYFNASNTELPQQARNSAYFKAGVGGGSRRNSAQRSIIFPSGWCVAPLARLVNFIYGFYPFLQLF